MLLFLPQCRGALLGGTALSSRQLCFFRDLHSNLLYFMQEAFWQIPKPGSGRKRDCHLCCQRGDSVPAEVRREAG